MSQGCAIVGVSNRERKEKTPESDLQRDLVRALTKMLYSTVTSMRIIVLFLSNGKDSEPKKFLT